MTTTDSPAGVTLLEMACTALAGAYKLDALTAGAIVAWLPDKEVFYVCFARYPTKDRRVTVSRGTHRDLEAAIVEAVQLWFPVAPHFGEGLRDEMEAAVQSYCRREEG